MRSTRALAVAIGIFGSCFLFSGTAFADTSVTATVGPVTIPSVPVSACVSVLGVAKCVATPPAQTVKLTVTATSATPSIAVTRPTITPIPCPAGTSGVAAAVSTGSTIVTVTGAVTVNLAGLPPITVPVAPTVALPNKTVKVYACTGAG